MWKSRAAFGNRQITTDQWISQGLGAEAGMGLIQGEQKRLQVKKNLPVLINYNWLFFRNKYGFIWVAPLFLLEVSCPGLCGEGFVFSMLGKTTRASRRNLFHGLHICTKRNWMANVYLCMIFRQLNWLIVCLLVKPGKDYFLCLNLELLGRADFTGLAVRGLLPCSPATSP